MKPIWLALVAAVCMHSPFLAGELPRDAVSIDYSRNKGLVAAAYRGGEVVLWDFESGKINKVFNASAAKPTWNRPLTQFNAAGRRLVYTQEGDAGLVTYDVETGKSTVLVPRRLLVEGIAAANWSRQSDTILVAIGRDIFLLDGGGHTRWQRRLETRALITDVEWHPSERFYTVATDDGAVSTWETASGRVIASAKLDTGTHAVPVKIVWTSEESLVAEVRGASLALLDPETLKPNRVTACHCLDFTWNGKEILSWAPPNIAAFSEAAQHVRDWRTPFDGEGTVAWAEDGRILTASAESTVTLRDTRSGKVLRVFNLPKDGGL
ncbi:MAG: WD40 repeat domain-containing protein [Bryobacteraceae bacterium]|jgi:WD40 repeat protein